MLKWLREKLSPNLRYRFNYATGRQSFGVGWGFLRLSTDLTPMQAVCIADAILTRNGYEGVDIEADPDEDAIQFEPPAGASGESALQPGTDPQPPGL